MVQGHTNPFLDKLEIFLSLNWYSGSAQQNSGDLVPCMPFLYFLRVFNAMGVILEISLCTFLLVTVFFPFPCGSAGKESTCSVGDLGSTPGLGRSPGEGKGYPAQYSGLGNSRDSIVHGVTKSPTQLSDFHFQVSTPEVHVSLLLLYTVEYLIPWPPLDARMEAKCSISVCWPDAQVTTGRLCPSGVILFHPYNNSMK